MQAERRAATTYAVAVAYKRSPQAVTDVDTFTTRDDAYTYADLMNRIGNDLLRYHVYPKGS